MIDTDLTLPASDSPAPVAGAVVLTGIIDGDGRSRLLVTCDDGATVVLPAESGAALPPVALSAPGCYGPITPIALVTDAHRATFLGVADRDIPAGAVLEVAWTQALGASVGWGEVAILAGPGTYGSPSLAVVAHGDAKPAMAGVGQVVAPATVTAGIARGSSLWGVLAAWQPPGSSAPMPTVFSSVFTVGAALCTVPGWRPSQAGGGAMGWDAWAGAHPAAMTVVVP